MLETMDRYPGALIPYIALTRQSAENIMIPALREVIEKQKLGHTILDSSLEIVHKSNGSKAFLVGADKKNFIGTLRGPKYPKAFIDECFHGNTEIDCVGGKKKIKDIKIGDVVLNAIGAGVVTAISKKYVEEISIVKYAGKRIICSSNHPFLTRSGWISAKDLNNDQRIVLQSACVRIMQKGIQKSLSKSLQVLFDVLRSEIQQDEVKPNEQSRHKEESFKNTKKDWSLPINSWWKWASANRGRKDNIETLSNAKVEPRNRSWGPIPWISDLLQSGLGFSRKEVSNRSRWLFSQCLNQKSTRHQKGREAFYARVEGVKSFKCSGAEPRRFGYFYDISVSGHPSFVVNGAVVHNCQNFREHIEELVDDVLMPAVSDYNGSVVLAGTPGPVPRGFFHRATTDPAAGFSVHKWSVFDNPHMPHMRSFVDNMMKLKGWTVDNPTYLREWMGQWVEDLDALFYKFRPIKNEYSGLVPHGTRTVMGIDLGFNDQAAFGIVAYHPNTPKVWVPHVEGESQMIPSEIAARVRQLIDRFKPSKIVIDTGGLGKSIAEELIRRYGIPCIAASKTDKLSYVRLLNGEFIDGNMLIHESLTELKDQYLKLEKDENGYEIDGQPNDLCDCILYAYREARGYAWQQMDPPTKDSAERFRRKEKDWLKNEEAKGMQQAKKEWWEVD